MDIAPHGYIHQMEDGFDDQDIRWAAQFAIYAGTQTNGRLYIIGPTRNGDMLLEIVIVEADDDSDDEDLVIHAMRLPASRHYLIQGE